ncbi:Speckle-type POZ protein-like [Araneus ventricosus]|uniref:Speckle-type POZ protein-like n=1 Tax=Araneus ventricosus TaxID=182803 RepID=A0A4Y2Q166_ARAVE|nr:Speckle-type POZ protein-like [Araneus ventricosus]
MRNVMNNGRKEYTFFWFIENYSYCWQKNGEALVSPNFTADGLQGSVWVIQLYPRGLGNEYRYFISLSLNRSKADDGPEDTSLKYEMSVLAADGSDVHSLEYAYTFKRGEGRAWGEFLRLDEKLWRRSFPQDILTVRCKIWKGEGNVHEVARICARTRIGIEKVSFLHVVKDFSTLEPNQTNTTEVRSHSKKECFVSSILYFTNDSCCEGKIILEIKPSGSSYILSQRKISLLDVSGNMIGCGENDNWFDVTRKDIQKLPLSLKRQEILMKESEYLSNNKLSLYCACSFSTGLEFQKIEETQNEIPMAAAKRTNNQELSKNFHSTAKKLSAYPSVSEDMKALYMNQCLTDLELKTKTKSFPAHKIVLCARSPVFKAMMTNNTKEKCNNCIQVDDLDNDVVQQLLLFLYSDTTENLQWKIATQLYYAADKYHIGKLKEVCSSFLVENLTTTNAGELLLLADTHSDIDLKKLVEDYILDHEKEVFGSKEWEMLMEQILC